MKNIYVIITTLLIMPAILRAQESEARGSYFYKKVYVPAELPRFEENSDRLPSPIWDENPRWV